MFWTVMKVAGWISLAIVCGLIIYQYVQDLKEIDKTKEVLHDLAQYLDDGITQASDKVKEWLS